MTMLDGDDASRREAVAVADAIDLVDNRHRRIARPHEIAVQGMNMAILLMLGILACVATAFAMFFVHLFKLSRASAGREIRVQRSARLEGSY